MAPLKDQLQQDLREAMRARDERRKSALRLVGAAIKNAEIAKGHELDDAEAMAVLQREVKLRRESIEEYARAGRQNLVDKEQAELAVLETYLPAQASDDDIEAEARRVIDELGASGPKDMGRVMPVLIERFAGAADGRTVSAVVRRLLAGA
jgi:uncharacterized protein YqeY